MRRTITKLPLYEGLPRYPNFTVMGGIRALDYAGTSVFAVAGSITAATCGMDLLGCTVVGTITALGGGTVRDVLFGKAPVFWLEETEYLSMAIFNAAAAFMICFYADPSHNLLQFVLFWGDTIGLGAFSVIGTMYAARMGCSFIVVMFCCMLTCTGGGIIRDILCRRPARVLHAHAEMYAEAAVAGGFVYMTARHLGLPLPLRALLGSSTVIAFRLLASQYDLRMWTLPQYAQNSLPTPAVAAHGAPAPTAK